MQTENHFPFLHLPGLILDFPDLLPPSNVLQYAECLKGIYRDFDEFQFDSWPPMRYSEYIIPSLEWYRRPFSSFKNKITLKDIFKPDHVAKDTFQEVVTTDVLGMKVLLDGSPGSGKSMLCHHYCKSWAEGTLLQGFFLVVYVALRDLEINSADEIETLLNYGKNSLRKVVAEELQATNGEGTLFIFDGWDELQRELRHKQSIICKILFRKVLPKCSVLITSRPHSSAWLKESKVVTRYVDIIGFTKFQVKECIANEFADNPPEGEKCFSLLQSRPDVFKLTNIPLNLAILMYIYKASDHTLPNTLTKIYQKFIINVLHHHVLKCSMSADTVEFHTANGLPKIERALYRAMCKLSFDGFCNDELVFSQLYLKHYHSELPENALGLMTATKSFTATGITSKYQFLHATVQEFLAAEALTLQNPDAQVEFLRQHLSNDRFHLMILFFCGQVQVSTELKDIFKYPAPISSSYLFYQHWYEESQHQKSTLLLLMQMVLESQNKELCNALSLTIPDMSLDFKQMIMDEHDYTMLSNFLCFGGCKWRGLHLEGCRSESTGLKLISEALSKSPKTLQFDNVTICPLDCDSDSINRLLCQLPLQFLKCLKLQRPYVDPQSGFMRGKYSIGSCFQLDIPALKLQHFGHLSSLTIDIFSTDELSQELQLIQSAKCITSLKLLFQINICIQQLDWSPNSVNNKAFGSWLPQCKVLTVLGFCWHLYPLEWNEHDCGSEFLLHISPECFQNVQVLCFQKCHLNSEQACQLFTYLHNSSITELDLSNNPHIFISSAVRKEELKTFFPIVDPRPSQELKGNYIEAAEALSSFLLNAKMLVNLILSGCGIDGISLSIIASGIHLCQTLEKFHVERSKITGPGVLALCSTLACECKSKPCSPLKLYLSNCGLTDQDTTNIAQLLQSSTRIAGLDLSSNRISTSGVSAIVSSISISKCPVKDVDFSWNDLSGENAEELSSVFETSLSTSCGLEELLIVGTRLKPMDVCGIASGLVRNSTLTHLKVSYSDAIAVPLVDILSAIKCNGLLQELSVGIVNMSAIAHSASLELDATLVKCICDLLQNNTTLTTLRLYQFHQCQGQDFAKLFKALKQNFTLKKLTLLFDPGADVPNVAVESDSVNLLRANEKKPYLKICIGGNHYIQEHIYSNF